MALSVWQRTIVTDTGDVIPVAEVEVREGDSQGALADLFADAAGTTPLTNPVTADAEGFVRFYVAGGRYYIEASGAGATLAWEGVNLELISDHAAETGGIHGAPTGTRLTHTGDLTRRGGDQQKYDPDAIIKYRFKAGNQLIGILLSGNTDVTIDWGDGFSDSYTADTTAEHTYADAGTYTVRISGRVDLYRLVTGEANAFRVESFGTGLGLTGADETLRGSGVKAVPQFVPEGVTSVRFMLSDTPFNQDISSWDVSSVTDMHATFYDTPFNQDISSWDVSSVTDMNSMLRDTPFNQDISSWDVSGVTDMNSMLRGAASFNQDISSWDVSSVTGMFAFLSGGQLSTANYDALLLAWAQLALQNDVAAHFGSSTYSTDGTGDPLTDPAAARQKIITDFNWTITDGGAA